MVLSQNLGVGLGMRILEGQPPHHVVTVDTLKYSQRALAVTIMLRIGAAFPVFKKLFYTCSDCNSCVSISARLVTLSSIGLTRKRTKSGKVDIARTKSKDKWNLKHASPTSSVRRGKDCSKGKKRLNAHVGFCVMLRYWQGPTADFPSFPTRITTGSTENKVQ